MTGHGIGGNTLLAQCYGHPHLKGKKQGLRDSRIGHARNRCVRLQFGDHREAGLRSDTPIEVFDDAEESLGFGEQQLAHANPLGTIAGIDERQLAGFNRRILDEQYAMRDDEKAMIQKHLLRARDEALTAGSAEAKHEKFRQAKGRIGNELSKRGYDLKKASDDWAAKQKKATP